MKPSYYFKVFFISFEFLILIISFALYIYFKADISSYFININVNGDALKWIIAYPVSIAGWIFKNGSSVIFPDEKSNRALHEWQEYWKLKAHFNIGLLYCILFSAACLATWFLNKLVTLEGAWIFCSCSIGLSILVYSFYSAKIELKSALIHID